MPCKATLTAALVAAFIGQVMHAAPAAAGERAATVAVEAFACTSWAGWREYVQASLTPRGATPGRHCPARIPAGYRVTIVGDTADMGGATKVRWRGKEWFIDEQRLDQR